MVLFDIRHSPPDDMSARVAPSQICEQYQTANADGAQVPQGKKRRKHIASVAAGEAFCESCCTVDMSYREHAQDPRESADGMPTAPVMNIRNTTGNGDNTVGAATGDDPDAAPEGKMERR